MIPESAHLSAEEMAEVDAKLNKTEIRSRFNFLKAHYGLRKGELHLVIAPPGGAKSTFVRSVIVDIIISNKCFLYLSEEPVERYVFGINQAYKKATHGNEEECEKHMDNLRVLSELDLSKESKTIKSIFDIWVNEIKNSGTDVFILDNITTSFLYGASVAKQGEIIQGIKNMAAALNIAIVMVVHTEKGTTLKKGFFSAENVRGNAMTGLMGSYNYVITKIALDRDVRVYVTIDKARYHATANKKTFLLNFEQTIQLYTQDTEVPFSEMVSFLKQYNEIGQPSRKPKERTW